MCRANRLQFLDYDYDDDDDVDDDDDDDDKKVISSLLVHNSHSHGLTS